MVQIKQIEHLTHEYSKLRRNGAGLGSVWAALVIASLTLLVFQQMYASYLTQVSTLPSFWSYISQDHFSPSTWLRVVLLFMPLITWLGMHIIQVMTDRRTGYVILKGSMTRKTRLTLVAVLLAYALIVIPLFEFFSAYAASDPRSDQSLFSNMSFVIVFGRILLVSSGIFWALFSRDLRDINIPMQATIVAFCLIGSAIDTIDIFVCVIYLISITSYATAGLYQFSQFKKLQETIELQTPEVE
jgi:hypothetical protein